MAYTQDERMAKVSSPLGDNALLLAELNAHESLSQPFFFDVALLSEKDNVDFGALIGKPLAVHLTLANGNERYFHGIVSRFSQGPSVGDFTSYRAEVVPFLWLLRRRVGCRIFQHKSAPDIIKAILGETGFSDYEFQLSGAHPEREYCVQFRESDLAFISRLAEEEGIAYFFKHGEKAHTLVLFDSPSANAPCPGQPSAVYSAAEDTSGPGGAIVNWRLEREFAVGKYALTDYNFEDPSMSLHASAQTAHPLGGNDKFEVYQFPGDYTSLSDGERRVKLRMQAEEAAAVSARAGSTCAAFTPGFRFDLKGHYRGDYNGAYLITEVVHRLSQDVGEAGRHSSYENDFACMPYSVPYRPLLRTPKPLIYGVQTATVVGASGKEIDVDKHGRVVVQFHWDREGKKNENSSCRVRVSQNWAGKGWGLVANPRIGQEVIVQFIDGDPDRPIIVGRVYNGEQVMGFGIPASDTQTGFISRSSPGGSADNANILRFEDKKGAEHVFLHAEKDNLIEVENDETHWIGRDRGKKVDRDEVVTIGRDRTQTIVRNKSEKIGANKEIVVDGGHNERIAGGMTVTVGGSFGHQVLVNHGTTVGGAMEISVGGLIAITSGAALAESVGGGKTENVGVNKTLTIGSSLNEEIGKSRNVDIKQDLNVKVGKNEESEIGEEYRLTAKKIQLVADEQFTLKVGKAEITLKKGGDVIVKGGDLKFEGTKDLVLKGNQIKEN